MLPVYQLTVSVRVDPNVLLPAGRASGQNFRSDYQLPNIAEPSKRGAEEQATEDDDTAGLVSLSLGKSDINAALERYSPATFGPRTTPESNEPMARNMLLLRLTCSHVYKH